MGITAIIAACICGFLTTISLAQGRGWRGVVPLHSTRSDVERLIGSPMMPGGITYDLKSERVNVVYSNGDCRNAEVEWNVPAGSVLGITVYPQTKVTLSDLQVDLNSFKKFLDPHIGDSIFANEVEGMSIRTTSSGEVISISYFPAARDAHLRCPGFSTRPVSNDELQYYKFDEYSNLSPGDEKARLDNFANRLRLEPQSKGYILAYAIRSTPSGQALARAKRARAYLIKRWRIEPGRVETRFAGSRQKVTYELYLVPQSVQNSPAKS